MALWARWQRGPAADSSAGASTGSSAVAPAPADPGWRSLATLQRTTDHFSPTVSPDSFAAALGTWQNPSLLAPLGHLVDADGPSGLVHGLTAPGRPLEHHPDHDLPLAPALGPSTSPDAVRRPVQRTSSADAPSQPSAGSTHSDNSTPAMPVGLRAIESAGLTRSIAVEAPRPLPVVARTAAEIETDHLVATYVDASSITSNAPPLAGGVRTVESQSSAVIAAPVSAGGPTDLPGPALSASATSIQRQTADAPATEPWVRSVGAVADPLRVIDGTAIDGTAIDGAAADAMSPGGAQPVDDAGTAAPLPVPSRRGGDGRVEGAPSSRPGPTAATAVQRASASSTPPPASSTPPPASSVPSSSASAPSGADARPRRLGLGAPLPHLPVARSVAPPWESTPVRAPTAPTEPSIQPSPGRAESVGSTAQAGSVRPPTAPAASSTSATAPLVLPVSRAIAEADPLAAPDVPSFEPAGRVDDRFEDDRPEEYAPLVGGEPAGPASIDSFVAEQLPDAATAPVAGRPMSVASPMPMPMPTLSAPATSTAPMPALPVAPLLGRPEASAPTRRLGLGAPIVSRAVDPSGPSSPASTAEILQRVEASPTGRPAGLPVPGPGRPGPGLLQRVEVGGPGSGVTPGAGSARSDSGSGCAPANGGRVQSMPLQRMFDPGSAAVSAGIAQRDADGSVVFSPPGGAPVRTDSEESPAPVQRADSDAASAEPSPAGPTPGSSTPSVAPAAAPGSASGAPMATADIEELARRLFDPLSARLKAEFRLDRERAGLITDLRH